MYKLLKTQHNYLKKQISAIINWEITKKIKRNQVIYEIKYLKRVLQSLHQEKKNEKWFFEQDINCMSIRLCCSD